jgi:hypothetical protein
MTTEYENKVGASIRLNGLNRLNGHNLSSGFRRIIIHEPWRHAEP